MKVLTISSWCASWAFLICLCQAEEVKVNDQSAASASQAVNATPEDIAQRGILPIHVPEVQVIKVVTDPDTCVCDGPYSINGCIRGLQPLGFFSQKSEPEQQDVSSVDEATTFDPREKTETEQQDTRTDEGDSSNLIRVVTGRASCRCGVANARVRDDEDLNSWKMSGSNFNCTLPSGQTKIVGGQPTTIRRYPWTVALVRSAQGTPFCGGTLINDRYVVTANHCVDGQSPGRIKVWVFKERFPSGGPSGTLYNVAEIKMNSGYNRQNIDNDIALLKLSSTVALGRDAVPACLPASNNNDFSGQTATVVGWGATSEGGSLSPVVREVMVPILSNQKCNTQTNYGNKITANMMCAGFDQGGRDSCQGDSGGPLIIGNGGRSTLVGVVSWGHGCARPKSPGVYARVARYPQWILQNTRDADWCEG